MVVSDQFYNKQSITCCPRCPKTVGLIGPRDWHDDCTISYKNQGGVSYFIYCILMKSRRKGGGVKITKYKVEEKKTALVKAVICFVVTICVYVTVFTNTQTVNRLMQSHTYAAPLTAMAIALLAAFFYGTAITKFLKHTLEKKLKSQELREE